MGGSYLWLVVVLHRHSDDIDPDDERDEEVKVVAGAEGVNVLPRWGIVSVVRPALGFCRRKERGNAINADLAACLAAIAMWPEGHVFTSYTHPDSAHERTHSSKPREMSKRF